MNLEKNIDEIIQFIDHIYETINIYHTLIFYNKEHSKTNLQNLINKLKEKEYPISIYNNEQDINLIELHSRIIVIEHNYIEKYFEKKQNDLSNITILLCLDPCVEKQIHDKINNNIITFAEKMYIFSCIR